MPYLLPRNSGLCVLTRLLFERLLTEHFIKALKTKLVIVLLSIATAELPHLPIAPVTRTLHVLAGEVVVGIAPFGWREYKL